MTKKGIELYEERKKRVLDALALKEPDRVPIMLGSSFLAAKYAGITCQEAMSDQDKWLEANRVFIKEFDTDLYMAPNVPFVFPSPVLEALGSRHYRWPGHGVGPDVSYQYVEGEYMKQDEYDHFLDNPTDFLIRVYLPRIFEKLEGFRSLPSLKLLILSEVGSFGAPEVVSSLHSLIKGAQIAFEWNKKYAEFAEESKQAGLYSPVCGLSMAPFDVVGDFLRGTRGIMMDMYQCPDKLLAAIDKVTPLCIEMATQVIDPERPLVFIPLHKGSDGFMSLKQFEKFYWPSLKKVMMATIDAGLIPCPFYEGTYDERLEYLAELPKGKTAGYFDRTDLFKAKEVIGDKMCLIGGMPVSLLQTGTPEQIKEYAKKLIDVVGKGGGFIMGCSSVLDETKPELLKVWVEFTREYGTYR